METNNQAHLRALSLGLHAAVKAPGGEVSVRKLLFLTTLHSGAVRATVRDMARHMSMPKSSVSRAADALQDAGLINRVPDIEDKRLVWFRITPRGTALVRRIGAAMADQQKA